MKRMICIIGALSGMYAGPANAAEYLFSFTGQGLFAPLNGSGKFTVADTPTTYQSRTAYTINGISGTFNGSAITALLPGFLGATNYYYLDSPFLDGSGVSFSTASGKSVNFFNQSSNGQYRINVAPFDTGFVAATTSAVTSAVPEPSTWAMMLIGFGFVGGAMRLNKRRPKLTVSHA